MNRWAVITIGVVALLSGTSNSFGQSSQPADYAPYTYHFDGYIYIRGTESWLDDSTGVMAGAVGSAILIHRDPVRHETDWILVEGRGLAIYPPSEDPVIVVTTPGHYVTTKLGGVRTAAAAYDRGKLNGALELLHRSTFNTRRPMLHAPFIEGLSYGAATRLASLVAVSITAPSGTTNEKLILTQNPPPGAILSKLSGGMSNPVAVTVSTDAVPAPAGDTQATAILFNTGSQESAFRRDTISNEFQNDVALDGTPRLDLYYKFVFTNPGRVTVSAPRTQRGRVLAMITDSNGNMLVSTEDLRIEELTVKYPNANTTLYLIVEPGDLATGEVEVAAKWQ